MPRDLHGGTFSRKGLDADCLRSMFGLRLITPIVIGVAAIVINFFQRHPLSQGIVKCAFSAVREVIAWVLNFVVEHIPVIGGKLKSARAKLEAAAHECKAAPNVDSAPSSPAPVEKRKPRQSSRHTSSLGFDEIRRPSPIEERASSSSSPNFKGSKAAKSKGTADPPAVALNSAVGSNSVKNDQSSSKTTTDEKPAPVLLIPDEDPSPPALVEDGSRAESLITDGPSADNASVPASGAASNSDTDSAGSATSPSPAPHLNLHASDGHAAKHRKNKSEDPETPIENYVYTLWS